MYEIFNTPLYLKSNMQISYSKYSSTYNISNKSSDKYNDTQLKLVLTDNSLRTLEDT